MVKDSSSSASAVDIALALIRREGCLLITRRPDGVHLGGYWEFPGGKCLPGERPEACAEREALEEVGVACRARRRPSRRHPAGSAHRRARRARTPSAATARRRPRSSARSPSRSRRAAPGSRPRPSRRAGGGLDARRPRHVLRRLSGGRHLRLPVRRHPRPRRGPRALPEEVPDEGGDGHALARAPRGPAGASAARRAGRRSRSAAGPGHGRRRLAARVPRHRSSDGRGHTLLVFHRTGAGWRIAQDASM